MSTPPLTAQELFTPSSQPSWLRTLLQNAAKVGLRTTQWQPGGITRTILAVVSWVLQIEDVNISLIAQGGFLDFAATGTVQYSDINGNAVTVYVTPDPSNPAQNPNGTLGWLDLLADSVFDVQRVLATYAGGQQVLVNTSSTTYGPLAAGSYHVADVYPTPNPTYSNTGALTIPPSAVVGTSISGVASGAGAAIQVTTSGAHGLTTGAVVALQGVGGVTNTSGAWTYSLAGAGVPDSSGLPSPVTTAWAVTVVDAHNFTLNGSQFGGTWTSGGLVYAPTVASFVADASGSESNSVSPAGGLPTSNAVNQAVTSLVGVGVANLVPFVGSDIEGNVALAARCRLKLQSISTSGLKGLYAWLCLNAQQIAPGLTNPFPPFGSYALTSSITRVQVTASLGVVSVVVTNAIASVSAGDLAALLAILQAYSPWPMVPFALAQATPQTCAVVATVWLPRSQATAAAQAAIQLAISQYFAALPIGGLSLPGLASNIIPLDAVIGVVNATAQANGLSPSDVTVTLNGVPADFALTGSSYVAQLSPTTPTVNLIGI